MVVRLEAFPEERLEKYRILAGVYPVLHTGQE